MCVCVYRINVSSGDRVGSCRTDLKNSEYMCDSGDPRSFSEEGQLFGTKIIAMLPRCTTKIFADGFICMASVTYPVFLFFSEGILVSCFQP